MMVLSDIGVRRFAVHGLLLFLMWLGSSNLVGSDDGSTVDADHLTVDVSRLLRAQERAHRRHVFAGAEPARGNALCKYLRARKFAFGLLLSKHRRVDDEGRHG